MEYEGINIPINMNYKYIATAHSIFPQEILKIHSEILT